MISRRTRGISEQARQAEEARVAALIKRDQAYRQSEQDREAAELEVRKGLTVNIGEAVVEPTEEWLEKGDFRTFTPRLEDGTVRTVKAYRRVITPTIVRLYEDGKIAERLYHACMVYRRAFDAAGLTGRFKSSYISLVGNVGGGSGGMSQHPMARHESEAEAREIYRKAREIIPVRFVDVFEYVVLSDMSLRAASLKARRDNSRLLAGFRDAGEKLADFFESVGVQLVGDAQGEH